MNCIHISTTQCDNAVAVAVAAALLRPDEESEKERGETGRVEKGSYGRAR